MTRPRLQMKCPIRSISASYHQNTTWESFVQECCANFSAPFAANEGADAVIHYMTPGRRRLKVQKVNNMRYIISSREGFQLMLCQEGEDSVLLCLADTVAEQERMEVGYYDAIDVAKLIGQIFSNYRKQQNIRMV